jgi:hypothetical protein
MKDDWQLVTNKAGTARFGFAVLLKFFELEARFPRGADEVPTAAVVYVADRVKVPPQRFRRARLGLPGNHVPQGEVHKKQHALTRRSLEPQPSLQDGRGSGLGARAQKYCIERKTGPEGEQY